MDELAIYYPHMTPPHDWVLRTLLLSDRIGSVVHPSLSASLSAELEELAARGLYEPRMAHRIDLLGHGYADEVMSAIAHFAGTPEYRFRKDSYPNLAHLQRLYIGKVPSLIEERLLDAGLAKLGRYGGSITVHRSVAEVLLAITAQYIASAEPLLDVRVITSTDDRRALNMAQEPVANNGRISASMAQQLLLSGLIPVPLPETPIGILLKFREKHRDELLKFRLYVGELIKDVQESDDPMSEIRLSRLRIESALADVRRAARGSKLELVLGSLVVAGLAAVTPFVPDALQPTWHTFDGIGAAAAAGLVTVRVRHRAVTGPSPVSYLAALNSLN